MTDKLPEHTEAFVLDANALLAYFQEEPGHPRMASLLEGARDSMRRLYMCVINLGEVMYILERKEGSSGAQKALALIDESPIEIIDADRSLTLAAAHLKMDCPIAFADCFAAALAQLKNAAVLTGDPEFLKIKPECNVRIEWLRSPRP